MLTPASLVDPRRGAGTGDAVIIRGDNRGILANYGVRQRIDALRQKQLADAKIKEDQERFKQLQAGLKIDDDTAPLYQKPYSDMVASTRQTVGSLYNSASPSYVADPFNRQGELDKSVAPVHTYKRLADDDWTGVIKPTVATGHADPELLGDDIEKQVYNAHYTGNDPVNGTLIAPQDLPRGYHEQILNDPRNINPVTAADNFAKKIPGSQDYATLIKGKPGTYSDADELLTRFAAIEPDGKGGHQVKLDASGRPVLRNPLVLLQAAQGTRFGKLLDYDVAQQNGLREAAVEKMRNNEPLTDAERAATVGPPKSKLDFLTDRLLGHVVVKSKESHQYIPLPRPRAAGGGGTGFVAPTGQLVGDTYEANLPTPDTNRDAGGYVPPVAGVPVLGTMNVTTPGAPIVGFQHLGQSEQPMRADKYGNPKAEVRARGFRATNYYSEDANGNFSEVANNRVPQDGVFGKSIAQAVDATTGKPLFGKSAAEIKAAIASGRAKPMLFVEYNTDKNSNFGRDYDADLQKRITANEESANPKSLADLEEDAKAAVSKGVSRQLVPFNPQNAQLIDAATKGHYRAAQATMLRNARGYKAQGAAAPPKRPTGTDLGKPKVAGTRKSGVDW